jgi:hypothetical protein
MMSNHVPPSRWELVSNSRTGSAKPHVRPPFSLSLSPTCPPVRPIRMWLCCQAFSRSPSLPSLSRPDASRDNSRDPSRRPADSIGGISALHAAWMGQCREHDGRMPHRAGIRRILHGCCTVEHLLTAQCMVQLGCAHPDRITSAVFVTRRGLKPRGVGAMLAHVSDIGQ